MSTLQNKTALVTGVSRVLKHHYDHQQTGEPLLAVTPSSTHLTRMQVFEGPRRFCEARASV